MNDSILITPKSRDEFELIDKLLKQMNVSSKVLSASEKEHLGLLMLMQQVDLNDLVPLNQFKNKLSK